jgi:hypothetical protein
MTNGNENGNGNESDDWDFPVVIKNTSYFMQTKYVYIYTSSILNGRIATKVAILVGGYLTLVRPLAITGNGIFFALH